MSDYLEQRVAELEVMVRDLVSRLNNIGSRGTLVEDSDDKKVQKQKIKGVYGEQISNVQRWETFGLTSRPPAGSDVLTFSMNGTRDETVILSATSPDHRPKESKAGSTTLYDVAGSLFVMDGAGNVTLKCSGTFKVEAGGDVELNSAKTQINSGSLKHNAKNVGDSHGHISAPPGPSMPPV